MTTEHTLTPPDARRIAVRAQLLDADRPTDLLDDGAAPDRCSSSTRPPPSRRAPTSCCGAGWVVLRPGDLRDGARRAAADRAATGCSGRPRTSRCTARRWRTGRARRRCRRGRTAWRDWVDGQRRLPPRHPRAAARRRARSPTRDLPDTLLVPWRSSGWNNDRNVAMLLVRMVARGEVAVAGRQGRERLWDLAERVFPDDPVSRVEEALRDPRRAPAPRPRASPRQARRSARASRTDVGEAGEPARGRGRAGARGGSTRASSDGAFAGRTALLSPLDRLVHRPQADGRAVRVRLPARDVQAGGEAPLGLLGAAGPPRRPPRRQGRRHRRPRGGRAARRRDPRGRALRRRRRSPRCDAELADLARWLELDLALAR